MKFLRLKTAVVSLSSAVFVSSVIGATWSGALWMPDWTDPVEGVEGHLAEAGGSSTDAWTYARYYGGQYYGGFPDRVMYAATFGIKHDNSLDIREEFTQYVSTPGTYLSTGTLWSAATYKQGWSLVDTDYDSEVDAHFDTVPPTFVDLESGNPEAYAVVHQGSITPP